MIALLTIPMIILIIYAFNFLWPFLTLNGTRKSSQSMICIVVRVLEKTWG